MHVSLPLLHLFLYSPVCRNSNPGPSNLFALIIGINEYDDPSRNLKGAICDLQRILEFLRSLDVPESNICTLANNDATRDRILTELSRLATDPRITPEHNTIFIYFTGHGSSMDMAKARASSPPDFWDDWRNAEEVEMICPCDFGMRSEKDGVIISGIPDRVFACYLNQIAKEKGDNIVSRSLVWHLDNITT
jgi:hypothetical protein